MNNTGSLCVPVTWLTEGAGQATAWSRLCQPPPLTTHRGRGRSNNNGFWVAGAGARARPEPWHTVIIMQISPPSSHHQLCYTHHKCAPPLILTQSMISSFISKYSLLQVWSWDGHWRQWPGPEPGQASPRAGSRAPAPAPATSLKSAAEGGAWHCCIANTHHTSLIKTPVTLTQDKNKT